LPLIIDFFKSQQTPQHLHFVILSELRLDWYVLGRGVDSKSAKSFSFKECRNSGNMGDAADRCTIAV